MNGREVPGANVNMYVSVLTMGFWPTYQPVSANLPAEVRQIRLELKSWIEGFFSSADYKRSLRNFI